MLRNIRSPPLPLALFDSLPRPLRFSVLLRGSHCVKYESVELGSEDQKHCGVHACVRQLLRLQRVLCPIGTLLLLA